MKSGWKKSFFGLFEFDKPYNAYELLETEEGTPSFSSSWQEKSQPDKPQERTVNESLNKNLELLKKEYRGDINTDLILRRFIFAGKVRACAAFMNGMADENQVSDFIIRPALRQEGIEGDMPLPVFAEQKVFCMQETELSSDWSIVEQAISEGRTVVFLDGQTQTIIMDTRGFASRSVPDAENEATILGPHEAFCENIRTNITLVRRIVKTPDFVCELRSAGGENNIRLAIAYRESKVNKGLLNEIKKRLANIDTEMIMANGTINQLIEQHPNSPIPQTLSTERPDRAAAAVMQGKVVLIVEGSPQVTVLPVTVETLLTSAEDAYLRRPVGIIVRLVRIFGIIITTLMPAYFLALTCHHQGMLSSEVLTTIISSRTMVFLPLPLEMIFLLLIFQLVREAGIRVPGAMGQAVGIIGGLILGQAAVAANIVSTIVLIIVALTGLGNFAVPDYSTQLALAYYRILLCLAAWIGGLLGVSCTILVTIGLLSAQKSFGVPFFTPFAPRTYRKYRIIRGDIGMHKRAEDYMNTEEVRP
ncbi:MAG: spore germination protein [Clostridia bacterium]|nr:spore germination protein [Clostridia bacterium]